MTEPPTPPPSNAGRGDELDDTERAELRRLRDEVAAYHAVDTAEDPVVPRRPRHVWRTVVAMILIIVGCVLVPVSVLAIWARNQVTDTDRYVATIAPLASEPNVQNALANRITTEIFNYVDVEELVNEAVDALEAQGLPDRVATPLRGLAGSIESGARSFVYDRALTVVSSEGFEQAWIEANRIAHQELVALLSGEESATVAVEEGAVTVDLAAFIEVVKQNLINAGFTIVERMPEVHPQFTIVQSDDLVRAQTGFRALDRLGIVLPIVALGLLAVGVYTAVGHRRALIWAGLGVAISMVVMAIALAGLRSLYLDSLPSGVNALAAADVFDTIVRFLRAGLRTVFVAGLVVAAGAFLSGPSPAAVRIRTASTGAIGRLRRFSETSGLRTGPVGAWAYRNRRMLRGGVVAVASLAFVFWERPTGKVVLLLAVLTLVALAIVEFLARPPDGARGRPGEPPETPAPA